jgi:hypothetical protein
MKEAGCDQGTQPYRHPGRRLRKDARFLPKNTGRHDHPRQPLAGWQSRFVYIQLGDGVIELLSSKPSETNLGLQHVAFLVNVDLNQAYEALLAQGLVFTVQPRLAGSGNGYLAFFREPGGAVFELIQREENIRIPDLKNDVLLAFASSTIEVPPDAFEPCAAFYRGPMGFSAGPVNETVRGRVQHFRHGRDTIELAEGTANPPLTRLTFQIASCSAMRDRLLEQGLSCDMSQHLPKDPRRGRAGRRPAPFRGSAV